MDILLYLIPIALTLGLVGLVGFMWALKNNQFDDMEGSAHRILLDDDEDLPAQVSPTHVTDEPGKDEQE